jgi:pimeloyl-ACP methyl ester carboxylesterase
MDTVRVDGRVLAYRRSGAGAPLVLLHGGWSDSRAWTPQLLGLSGDADVIAVDIPGCGASDDPPEGTGLDGYADAIAGLLDALHLPSAHLGGLSAGSVLALEVYRRHAGRVRSLVLAGAYAGWRGSLPPEEVAARVARLEAELDHPPEEWMDDYLPTFFAGEVPAATLDLVRTVMRDVRPTGTRRMLTAFAAADLRDVLPMIAVPTLLLYGAEDARAPRAVAEAMHRALPRSRLVLVPGAGHDVALEAPDAFDAEVRGFLRSLPPGAA